MLGLLGPLERRHGWQLAAHLGERTSELAIRLMAEGKVDLAPLLTHTFRLADYRLALETVTSKGTSGVIKGAFVFGADRG